ncbi:MAG: ankyrin repeat domain-containing protein [Planctomycetes bacterium]|nr:ankyrin repeat domain-containing protein [Planctomycetota bacterium]
MIDEKILFSISCARDIDEKARNKQLKEALKDGADVLLTDKNGVSALHFAVRFRHPDAVKILLEYGAEVNLQCKKSGSTPLHRAVTNTGAPGTAGMIAEMREIVKVLLQHGADMQITNKKGSLAIDYAKDTEIIDLLT